MNTTSELISSALDGAARKGRGVKGLLLAALTAGVGFAGHSQLQHNADLDRRVGSLETVTSAVRAQSAATATNVEWLVRVHGGSPELPHGGSAAAVAVPAVVEPPVSLDTESAPVQP